MSSITTATRSGSSRSAGFCRSPHRVITGIPHANCQVDGADKILKQMNREGIRVARCTVERLMGKRGLAGARRGKRVRTTTPDTAASCPRDRVNRQFNASRPNELWVSDFTYVSTWQGWFSWPVSLICRPVASSAGE
jgi:transposase InsO family protein